MSNNPFLDALMYHCSGQGHKVYIKQDDRKLDSRLIHYNGLISSPQIAFWPNDVDVSNQELQNIFDKFHTNKVQQRKQLAGIDIEPAPLFIPTIKPENLEAYLKTLGIE